ncbi:hypothetical protein NQT69_08230 [Pseudoalteromonas shioyasakiensis]|uniref:hypothetical protein n=1 Tax=Pseudoalteromonas shioyasakiensis TaxID=1190813 RepID=UPI0021194078|nr:hypothetical protein [Pseudoalteromonas shioyasakiensis]MCQ8877980.1 hypothetical protein [Pseudoalteromonas shioyasakiensis]
MPFSSHQVVKYILLSSLVLLAWLPQFQHFILDFIDQALIQSGIVYASARSINAAISLLQSAEVGIGVASIQPAQLLDPINDLAEYTSDAMRLAIGSLFIQRVLYTISSGVIFSALFTFVLAGYFICVWRGYLPVVRDKIIYTLILIRFLVPAIVLSTGLMSQLFLDAQIDQQNMQVSDKATTISNTANATSELSNEFKAQLQSRKQTTLDKLTLLHTQQVQIHQQITTLKLQLSQLEQQIESIQQQRSFTEKLTFTELEQAQPLRQQINLKENKISQLKQKQDKLNQQKYSLEDELKSLNQQLTGDNKGQISQVIAAVSQGMTTMLDNIEDLFNDFLNLLSLLVLKLLLMPLLFLYLFKKTFTAIWQRSFTPILLTGKTQQTNLQ